MASNTSQRKAQSLILAARVTTYATWALHVTCGPCGMAKSVPMATLPPELTVMQVLMRMRCRSCGGKVETAAIGNQVPDWRSRVVRIWGSGSYG